MDRKKYISKIFKEVSNLDLPTNVLGDDGMYVFYSGIKVSLASGEYKIESIESDFYRELSDEEILIIFNNGFKVGALIFSINKNLKRLKDVNQLITHEIQGRKNYKKINHYKNLREYFINQIIKSNGSIQRIKKEECKETHSEKR